MEPGDESAKDPLPPDETPRRGWRKNVSKFLKRRQAQDQPSNVLREEETEPSPTATSILTEVNKRLKAIYGTSLANKSIITAPAAFEVPGLEHHVSLLFQTMIPPGRETGVPIDSMDTQVVVTSADYTADKVGKPTDPFVTFMNGKNDQHLGATEPAIVFNRTHPVYRRLIPNSVDLEDRPEELEKRELQIAHSIAPLILPLNP